MSGSEFRAHLKFAFHVFGFGFSLLLYLPVCSAHARNKHASVFICHPFREACFHGSLKTLASLSTHSTPGYLCSFKAFSSHGRIRSLSIGISCSIRQRLDFDIEFEKCLYNSAAFFNTILHAVQCVYCKYQLRFLLRFS